MFGLFGGSKKKSLEKKYKKLVSESNRLSTINRAESDAKFSEAQNVMDEIIKLKS